MDEFPMRINRYLAQQGHATRRAADELITRGKVYINGRKAELGDKVQKDDLIEVKTGKHRQTYLYFAYNKPRGVITHSPGEGEEDILGTLPELKERGAFPIGRLDKDSHGLLILTNDGRVTDRLLSPKYDHEKEYAVRTKHPLSGSFKKRLEEGVLIEGYQTKPSQVRITGENSFNITLTEGKKHQIRRMVVALKNEVSDLRRIRILNIRIGSLKGGAVRPIEGEELEIFLKTLGLS